MVIPFWRDVALLILMAEVFLFGLPFLALFFLLVRVMRQVRKKLESVLPQVRERVEKAEAVIGVGARVAIIPVVEMHSRVAGFSRAVRSFVA